MRYFSLILTSSLAVACSNDVARPNSSATLDPGSAAGLSSSPSSLASSFDSSTSATSDAASSDSAAAEGPFRLLYRDEFDELDLSRWQLMTHSWGGNIAVFSDESPLIEEGKLLLRLLPAPDGTNVDGEDKAFLGAEVRSKATLTYGRVRARVRFARASAVVSSLVTIYTPWPADNWNELDIELLGKDPNEVQFNTMIYDGPPVEPPVTESVSPTQDPYVEDLGFDSSLEFHEYTIEWTTPEAATFWVDGERRYSWSDNIALMTLPQNVLLTIWASDSEGWVGPVTAETTGATVTYDWVELWEYTGLVAEADSSTNGGGTASVAPATDPSSTGAPSVTSATGGEISTSEDGVVSTSGGVSTSAGSNLDSTSEAANTSNVSSSSVDTDGTSADSEGLFQLVFRDDFESLDTSRWQLMTHSWDSNLALFSADSVSVADDEMTLTLLTAPAGTSDDTGAMKQFLGAEVRSTATVQYGRVRARARFTNGSGVVSALVTIYTPWPADNWNELDIEHLGAEPSQVQFNTMVYLGEQVSPSTSVTPTQFPQLVDLGFDASADFHEYEMEWTPQYVRFSVDGVQKHRWTEHVDLLGLPQNVLLTIWASSSADWAGEIDETTASSQAVYDWVEVYEYTGGD